MSLAGGYSQSVNDAVSRAIAAGVTFAVAASNDGKDACSYSPASTPNALTIGATDAADVQASFSNWGRCVDLYAPGVAIRSSVPPNGYEDWNGTSMASPHVAGAAALYLAAHPAATPADVSTALTNLATRGVLQGLGAGSPNRLLYMAGVLGDPTPPMIQLNGAPADGAKVSGTVTFTIEASDAEGGVAAGEISINGSLFQQFGPSAPPPWSVTWDAWDQPSGTYAFTVTAFDDGGHSTSVTRQWQLRNDFATYDATLRAPQCAAQLPTCKSGSLLDGRGPLGPETNQPNTLGASCADGTEGSYHGDESLDRLGIYTLDGSPLAPGKPVRIEAKVWAWAGNPSMDHLDLWLAPDASSPTWTCLTTLNPTVGGALMLTHDTILPATTARQMAVRGIFRYSDPSVPDSCIEQSCVGNGYDDQDDLVFTVVPTNTAPVVDAGPNQTVKKPRNGSWTANLVGSATDDGMPNPPGALSYVWSKSSGPGTVTFGTPNAASTTARSSTIGTYVLKLTVSDGALSASDTVTITATN